LPLVEGHAGNYCKVFCGNGFTLDLPAGNIRVSMLQAVQQLLGGFIEHTRKRTVELSAFFGAKLRKHGCKPRLNRPVI
jgi:hypothetical protein